ncbi:MAG TPA: hypothetical protein PKB06_11225 [Actinotalea sp.]|nr:hypothetical protein [Actinotalea sp.]
MPWFVVTGEPSAVAPAVLEAIRGRAGGAELRGSLADAPPEVRELRERVAGRRHGPLARFADRMRALTHADLVRVHPDDDEGWRLLTLAAPWAEAVDVVEGNLTLARVHEAGGTAVVQLGRAEGQALAARLGEAAVVHPIEENRPWFRVTTAPDPRRGVG